MLLRRRRQSQLDRSTRGKDDVAATTEDVYVHVLPEADHRERRRGRIGDLADDKADNLKMHEGKVVSVTGAKLVMSIDGKEHAHDVADNAKIRCDGKICKLDDLKPGQKIRVTTKKGDKETAVKVEALDKNEKFGQRDR